MHVHLLQVQSIHRCLVLTNSLVQPNLFYT